jgi:hypothetical protein
MKKRAHIPHNYEMSFEIRQEGHVCGGYQSRKAEQCVASTGRL